MAGVVYRFGAFQLDPASRSLTANDEPVMLPARHFDLLHLLVARAGQVLSKDALIEAAWEGVAVTDNSVEQVVSALRRLLRAHGAGLAIETQARRGYRFSLEVERLERREPDAGLDTLLAPHRAWIEGRAALETLERSQVVRAREVFERVLAQVPDQASAHVGLANAGVMQFEMTRADRSPDVDALAVAARHAREACRLDPRYGEAWATLGFVLDRTGHHDDALAASRMAVSLEGDNWRHHVRLAYVSWGEERLREARRTLSLLPGFPMAHWLAATVHVARGAFDAAERELRDGIAAQDAAAEHRFAGVALHWLLGLILLARGDESEAMEAFARELRNESSGQLYARECCANTWYGIGAVHLRRGELASARAAFVETLTRVPVHPLARAAISTLAELGTASADAASETRTRAARSASAAPSGHAEHTDAAAVAALASGAGATEIALARAVVAARLGRGDEAVLTIDTALAAAPPGSALWLLPVEPLLRVWEDPRWTPVLARLRNRAA